MIKKLIIRGMKLPKDEGVSTFSFSDVNKGELRKAFKETINAISINSETRERLKMESILVFKQNNSIVSSLYGTSRIIYYIFKYIIALVIVLITVFYLISNSW